jgi:serpin B
MGTDDEVEVNRELAILENVSTGTRPWLEPAELRRRGKNRRLRRRGGVIGAALVVVVLLATLIPIGLGGRTNRNSNLHVAATSGPAVELVSDTGPAGPVSASPSSNAVARSEQQFSLSLLKQISASSSGSSNIVVSPLSLATALAMLELGAKGSTETQIAHTLGTNELTAEQQAAGWSALSAELAQASASAGIAMQSANSLWLQKGLDMDPSFMSDLSRYFASGVWQVDFASDPSAAVAALNTWVARETHGHISSLFAPGAITNQTALVLANAVYFKAAWQQPFTAATFDGTFHLPAGTTASVPFMHTPPGSPLDVPVSTASRLDAVQLPYVSGRMAALVIMPTSGPLSNLTSSLTPTGLDQIVSGMKPASLDLAMPTLSLSDSHELIPTLQNLGMRDAFVSSNADLSGLSPTPLYVTDVVQKATLDVTPWGTEATAATGIAVGTSARPASIALTIDHPFLFLIRDTHTGAILFEAQVDNPATG